MARRLARFEMSSIFDVGHSWRMLVILSTLSLTGRPSAALGINALAKETSEPGDKRDVCLRHTRLTHVTTTLHFAHFGVHTLSLLGLQTSHWIFTTHSGPSNFTLCLRAVPLASKLSLSTFRVHTQLHLHEPGHPRSITQPDVANDAASTRWRAPKAFSLPRPTR